MFSAARLRLTKKTFNISKTGLFVLEDSKTIIRHNYRMRHVVSVSHSYELKSLVSLNYHTIDATMKFKKSIELRCSLGSMSDGHEQL